MTIFGLRYLVSMLAGFYDPLTIFIKNLNFDKLSFTLLGLSTADRIESIDNIFLGPE